jgi:hypothetical protein
MWSVLAIPLRLSIQWRAIDCGRHANLKSERLVTAEIAEQTLRARRSWSSLSAVAWN